MKHEKSKLETVTGLFVSGLQQERETPEYVEAVYSLMLTGEVAVVSEQVAAHFVAQLLPDWNGQWGYPPEYEPYAATGLNVEYYGRDGSALLTTYCFPGEEGDPYKPVLMTYYPPGTRLGAMPRS